MSKKYGRHHQRVRAALLPGAYGRPCFHCGLVMRPDQALELDHIPGTDRHRDVVHARCNQSEGGRRGYRRMLERRGVRPGGVFPD